MKKALAIFNELLRPPKWVLLLAPPVVFAALIYIFLTGQNNSALAYPIYGLSAYCLTVLILPLPKLVRNAKVCVMRRINDTKFGGKYVNDLAFRGSVSIYRGMAVNFLYVLFRIVVGIRYASMWFISMAVYYLVLAVLRLSLILNYRHKSKTVELLLLSVDGEAAVSAQSSYGRDDPANGADKLRVLLSGVCDLPVGNVYFLYNSHIRHQPCQIPQTGQPDPICG